MRFSRLQKYIILKCFEQKNRVEHKTVFYAFYPLEELRENKKNIQDAVHKSLESLVARDLLTVFGRKTAKKWFIHKAKLTTRGRRAARELTKSRQRKLPIK